MGEDDVGMRESVTECIGESVSSVRNRGGSSTNNTKHLKQMRRVRKAAAVRLSPFITPRSRCYGLQRKRER